MGLFEGDDIIKCDVKGYVSRKGSRCTVKKNSDIVQMSDSNQLNKTNTLKAKKKNGREEYAVK